MKNIAIIASVIASALALASCASQNQPVQAPAPTAQTVAAPHHHCHHHHCHHHHDYKGETATN